MFNFIIKRYNKSIYFIEPNTHWCSVVYPVVQWLSLLHNFIQQSLNSRSAQVQILLAACRRFAMVMISDNGSGWKKGLTPFVGQPYRKNNSMLLDLLEYIHKMLWTEIFLYNFWFNKMLLKLIFVPLIVLSK